MKKNQKQEINTAEIILDIKMYPREPLLATCCVFMDAYYVWFDLTRDNKRYRVILTPKNGSNKRADNQKTAGEFRNELINNALRYQIASRNQRIREYIVKEALFFSQPKKEQKKAIREMAKEERRLKDAQYKDPVP